MKESLRSFTVPNHSIQSKSPVTPAERCWSVAGAVNKIHHRSIPFTTALHTLATAKGRHKRESKTRNKKQGTKRFSTFAVSRLRHSETKKNHCLIRESCLNGTCAKQPINNISEVTWLCTWFPK